MPIAQVNGIELFYTVQGENINPPLLLISGFNSDSSAWASVMSLLVKHYQVIRFDNRGIGRSTAPDHPYTVQQMAADTAALLDSLSIETAHIAGHSMGGQIAQELALAYPGKVQSLSLLSCWAQRDAKFNSLIQLFGDLAQQLDSRLYHQILVPWLFTESFYSIPDLMDQLLAWIDSQPFPPTPHGLYHQSRAVLTSGTIDRLAQIHCPTLVLVGQEDLLTPVRFSQQLAEGIPGAELVVIEQGGHSFIVETPVAVGQAMLRFLASVTGG